MPSSSNGGRKGIRRLIAIGIALCAGMPGAGQAVPGEKTAIFYIDNDVDPFDFDRLTEILVRNGASVVVVRVPFGRATHLLAAATPGCGFLLSRDIPGREAFQWLAPTLRTDFAIGTGDPAQPMPRPGDLVASYGAQTLLDALTKRGYRPLIYHSSAQAAKLIQTNRTRFIAGAMPSLLQVEKSLGQPITPVEALGQMDLWLGCNPDTPAATAQAVQRAWAAGMANGEIGRYYQTVGLDRFLPGEH